MSFINKRIQFIKPRKNGRRPSNWPVDGGAMPMRITRLFPMKLKEVDIEKLNAKRAESDVYCINELMTLFDCFEKSDYNASVCQQQAAQLEQCYSTHMSKKFREKLDRKLKEENNK